MKRPVKQLGLLLAALAAVLAIAVVGPALLRTDSVHFRWAGAIGSDVLLQPIGVAYRDGLLYVSDAGHDRLVVFDTAGSVREVWDDPSLAFSRPMHLTLDVAGRLAVPEYLNDRVSVLDRDGDLLERVGGDTGGGPGQLDAPGGAAFQGGDLFVADFYNHRVEVLGPTGPRRVGGSGRVRSGLLHYPTDIAVGPDSLIYVADAYNHRIQVFRPDGTYVRKWGGPFGWGGRGGLRGWFRIATGVDVSGSTVYVADFENNRIQLFTDQGGYLGQIADSLRYPTDITKGAYGELYVVDFGHDRIARFAPEGS